MDSDLNLVQMLLDSEPVVEALGFPVNTAAFIESVRAIRDEAARGRAVHLAAAWNALAGGIGPKLTAALLSGDEWQRICPPSRALDDYDADDFSQAVWIDDESMVIGRACFEGQHLTGVRFAVQPRW